MHVPSSQTGSSARPGLHVAGMVAMLVYGTLAWGAQAQHPTALPAYFALMSTAWAALGIAWRSAARSGAQLPVTPILAWAVVFRVIAFSSPPLMEDDYYRYLWDGRETVVHGNPYSTTPQDHFSDTNLPPEFDAILGDINYPHLPTIYGPGLQAAFAVSYAVAPGVLWPLKLILIGADLVVGWILWRLAGRQALLLYLWCPLSIQETAFTAHPEILGILWTWLAVAACKRGRDQAAGVFLGLGAATKITGVLLIPFLLRRASARGWMLCALTVAGAYLPFWLQGSWADLPSLATFAREWEFNSGGFALLKGLLGPAHAPAMALALIAAFMALVWWREPPGTPLARGDWIFGWFFAWTAVVQPWYLLWLLPWVVLRPSVAGWTALVAVSLSYATHLHLGHDGADLYGHPAWVRIVEYSLVGAALLVDAARALTRRASASGRSEPEVGTRPSRQGTSVPAPPGAAAS